MSTVPYPATEMLGGDSPTALRSARSNDSVGVTSAVRRARTVAWGQPRIVQGRALTAWASPGAWPMTITPVVVGIDVAQAELVVAVRPTRDAWTVPNDEGGVADVVRRLRPLHPALVVMEATGGYERLVVATLAAAGAPGDPAGFKLRAPASGTWRRPRGRWDPCRRSEACPGPSDRRRFPPSPSSRPRPGAGPG